VSALPSCWRTDAPPLRPYQEAAVEWLSKRGSYGLFDEMRLGKTVTTLRDFANVREQKRDARLLVVAPNNVIYNSWRPEVEKWTTLSVEVASGTALQRVAAIEAGADVTVIAYDNLARELDRLNEQRFYYSLFDEAHAIKGPKALRTKAALALRCAKRGMVTATPMLNRVDELWALLFMIAPREFPSYWNFVTRYAVFGGYEGRQIIGIQNSAELRAKMGPYCLRRLRREVMADMPMPEPVATFVDLAPKQRAMYDTAVNELKVEIESGEIHEFDNPLTKLLRLRQIIATPACLGAPDESAVLDAAMEEILGTDPNRKIVVFTQFLGAIHAMRQRLDAAGIGHAFIQGEGSTASSRAETILEWAGSPRQRVLLASYGVAREGIDLSAADKGICLDLQWVPALQAQAEARLVNLARKQVPEIVRIHTRKTVDARVLRLLQEKQIAFNEVIEDNEFDRKVQAITLRELLEDAA
jgi:SNF2 family DNA or RNA helicase